MKLSDHQKQALHKIVVGLRDKELKEQTLGGYAGTGKTTLIKYLTQFYPNFGVCAYTGKAANVLRKKGMSASTIHSRIYEPEFYNGQIHFNLTINPGCEGFIVDESSMVSREIYDDLKCFDLPLVFVGDHGQLEPVDSDFNLMDDPMYTLEEIHRNAGTIARFAEHIRMGFSARGFKDTSGKVKFLSQKQVTDDLLSNVDQVICAYNATRVGINTRMRNILGHEGVLNVGERVMCLRNNKEIGLFNGMQGTVMALYKGKRGRQLLDFEHDNAIIKGVPLDMKQFGQEKYNIKHGKNTLNPFDYAYGITCHKAQGDEFKSLLVLEQKCKNWSHRRWAYTAASRAKEKLYWKLA